MPTSTYANQTIAYVDRNNDDEIVAVDTVDFLPRSGTPLTLVTPFADRWIVFEVVPVADPIFAAFVYLNRSD